LQQVDTPQNLFDNPVNLFVAGFMGSPAMNFTHAELIRDGQGSAVVFAGYRLPVPDSTFQAKPGLDGYIGRKIILGVRPSDFEEAHSVNGHGAGWAHMQVKADVTEELGSEINVLFTIDAPPVEHEATQAARDRSDDDGTLPLTGDKSLWTARVNARSHVRPGEEVELVVDTHRLHFFDPATGLAIGHPANIGR